MSIPESTRAALLDLPGRSTETIMAAAVAAYEREAGNGSCDRAAMALALEAATVHIIRAALERAAQACEDEAVALAKMASASPKSSSTELHFYTRANGAEHCAHVIRALMPPLPAKEGM